jgi:glycosyltransferase involved in cell wall biosynthesis
MGEGRIITQSERPRVLVIGPRRGSTGGVAMFTDILLASRLNENFELIHLETTRTAAGSGKADTLAPINFLYFARQYLRLLWILLARRPRIVHLPITSGISFWKACAFLSLARFWGVPTIGHLHGATFHLFFESSGSRKRGWIAGNLRGVSTVIALSEGWRRFLLESVSDRLNVVVVPNTIETDFARWAERVERPAGRSGVMVLYLGRLWSRKGVVDSLRAAPRVRERAPGTRFVFAGEPTNVADREEIERACAAAGGEGIEFPGAVSGDAKRRLFAEADIFLLPSFVENQPIAVLEAMAAGLPLVVTPVGSMPEFLEEGRNALFVQPGDPEEIASKLTELAARPELRRSMGEANRAKFRDEFGPERMVARLETIYRSLLDGDR